MNLQYPIGEFSWPHSIDDSDLSTWLSEIETLPGQLRTAVEGLDDQKLGTPYRPDGWNLRQVVHHIADSHMNSYIRFKLAITEDQPTVRTYEEAAWARIDESHDIELRLSLDLIDALHARWVPMLRALSPEQLTRTFTHPDWQAPVRLDQNIALYAWHGKHHLAQITTTRDRHHW